MDIWNKARSFAEEAAKRSSELTKEAARRSSELSIGSAKLGELVTEASKRSKEIAAEASKRADQIRTEAAKRADIIKSSFTEGIAPPLNTEKREEREKELEKYGINEELRDFVKGITLITFQDFPLSDDSPMSDVPMPSNVTQDLTEWQEKHANLVLSTVKEISKLRYELCPRVMKERKFWRIYFILVNSHVAPYEKQYMEKIEQKSAEQVTNEQVEDVSNVSVNSKPQSKEGEQHSKVSTVSTEKIEQKSSEQVTDEQVKDVSNHIMNSKPQSKETEGHSKVSTLSTEQDLDMFLLGGDSDEGPEDGDEGFDDDFDKMVDSSDDEKDNS